MALIFIKPAVAGNIVRHPEKLAYTIAQEGEYVEDSNQWQRYLRHGDVVLAEPPQIKEEKQTRQKQLSKEGE